MRGAPSASRLGGLVTPIDPLPCRTVCHWHVTAGPTSPAGTPDDVLAHHCLWSQLVEATAPSTDSECATFRVDPDGPQGFVLLSAAANDGSNGGILTNMSR